jgi:hypothetical protein
MEERFKYKIIEDFVEIRQIIVSNVNRRRYIGFSISPDSLAISYEKFDEQIYSESKIKRNILVTEVLIFKPQVKDDILLLINSENINKLTLFMSGTLAEIRKIFGEVSCNSFINVYTEAEKERKLRLFNDYKFRLDEERKRTNNNDTKLALISYYSYIIYNMVTRVTPLTNIPRFNSFCLFFILNIINSELSKENKKLTEPELAEIIMEEEAKLMEKIRLPCTLRYEVLDYLYDNKILIKEGKYIKIIIKN